MRTLDFTMGAALTLALMLSSCSSSNAPADTGPVSLDSGADMADSGAADGGGAIDAATGADGAVSSPDGGSSDICFPMGIYGNCAETGCSNCLDGAGIYSTCSSGCTDASQCGDAADFNGATPFCAPLNPGAADMICVLICTSTDQCPCGLECRASGAGPMICATTL